MPVVDKPRRAALLMLSLCALILAATLMPSAGLGTFPSSDWDGDVGPVSHDSPSVTAEQNTVTDSEATTEAETTGQEPTDTPTVTTTDEMTTSPPTKGSDGGAFGAIVSLLVAVLWLAVGSLLGYPLLVASVAVTFGSEAVSRLPFGESVLSLPQATMAGLIGASTSLARIARTMGSALSGFTNGLGSLLDSSRSVGYVLRSAFEAFGGLSIGLGSMVGSLGGAISTLIGGTGQRRTDDEATTTDARETAETVPESPTDVTEDTGPLSVAEAWGEMADRLGVRNRDAKTPTELASAAIERGWPAEAVEQLTNAFREVRYGNRDPEGERLAVARRAHQRLQEHWRGSE